MTTQTIPLLQSSDLHKYIVHSAPLSDVYFHEATRRGVLYECADYLEELLKIDSDCLVDLLGISRTTLRRREEFGRLSPDETDRITRIVKVLRLTYNTFSSLRKTRIWLKRSHSELHGAVPLDLMETYAGCKLIRNELKRIDAVTE